MASTATLSELRHRGSSTIRLSLPLASSASQQRSNKPGLVVIAARFRALSRTSLPKVVGAALLGVVVVNAVMLGIMFGMLAVGASSGEAGATVATAEYVKTIFPYHFAALMWAMTRPLPNYAARAYAEQQRPLFAAAARGFRLHPDFAATRELVEPSMTWHGLIHARTKSMARLLREEGRDGFMVEKDRCEMYKFFAANDFPICEVRGVYETKEAAKQAFASGAATAGATQWPLFLKACHLTQSSSRGTRAIAAPPAGAAALAELGAWVDAKAAFRPDDFDREWRVEGNELTDYVARRPRFLLQAPMTQPEGVQQFDVQSRIAVGLFEMKVEVLWGRAYLGLLDGTAVFRRDDTIEDYSTALAMFKIAGAGEHLRWIVDEGYTACVWDLAERVARTMGIEALRVDIFLRQGDPSGCVVNEDSLSSGMVYYGHEDGLTEMWRSGFLGEPQYSVINTTKQVYEMTEADLR